MIGSGLISNRQMPRPAGPVMGPSSRPSPMTQQMGGAGNDKLGFGRIFKGMPGQRMLPKMAKGAGFSPGRLPVANNSSIPMT